MIRSSLLPSLFITTIALIAMPVIEAKASNSKIMFDDFSYKTLAEVQKNGWLPRTQSGHPGIKNLIWWPEGLSFHPDQADADNTVMRLTSKTDGSAENTRHSQICHQRKYLEGTYAARLYFNDQPDFCPNGGKGEKENVLFSTSWQTFNFSLGQK